MQIDIEARSIICTHPLHFKGPEASEQQSWGAMQAPVFEHRLSLSSFRICSRLIHKQGVQRSNGQGLVSSPKEM